MVAANSALASLVTQAPPDDVPDKAAYAATEDVETAPRPAEKEEAEEERHPRRCFCFRKRADLKLAAVHPVAPAEVAVVKTSPQPPQQRQVKAEPELAHPPEPRPTAARAGRPAAAPSPPAVVVAPPEEEEARTSAPAAPAATAAPTAAEPPAEATQMEWGQLGPQAGPNIGRKTLVLDLDETLVHSSFRTVPSADIVITVELDGEHHPVYVRKRPGVDAFLDQVAQLYEVVVYTASMSKYADPLLDELDKAGTVTWRLYREACTRLPNGYTKDLSRLGRDLKDVIIIDNSPMCYALQPNNAIPIRTWREDPTDRELIDLIPILHSLAAVEDIPMVLKQIVWTPDD